MLDSRSPTQKDSVATNSPMEWKGLILIQGMLYGSTLLESYDFDQFNPSRLIIGNEY